MDKAKEAAWTVAGAVGICAASAVGGLLFAAVVLTVARILFKLIVWAWS